MHTFDFFPYGTQYHRAPTPLPDEWEEDLAELSAQGYTHVQFRPQWRWHEAQRGEFVFDDLDRLFELAQEYSLRVILKPMLETAPDWVFSELGGTRIGFHGVPISPFAHGAYYVGGWWPCFDNPAVMEAARAFVTVLIERYRAHPALWLYNAWNEPRSRPIGSCQCGHSKEAYRTWLRQRFATVDDLNDFYGKRWSAFETIDPPCSMNDYAEMTLWRDWAAEATSGHVKGVIEAIKSADATRPVMFHRGGVDVLVDIAWDSGDDLRNRATGCDWYGLSCPIEFHPQTPQDHALVALTCDWMRRVDPHFWVAEFYPQAANWTRPPRIDHLQRQSLMAIASGSFGFTWWQYRCERVGNETNGFGLTEINGAPTPRSEYAAALANLLRKEGHRLITSAAPRAKVALLYDRRSDLLSRMTLGRDTLSGAPETPNIQTPYKLAMTGAHALLWLHNFERDFVIPGDDLSGYSVLWVSAAEVIKSDEALWLRRYVEEGGTLVVEFPFACREVNTWVTPDRPAFDLDELLGCRESGRVLIDGRADDRVLWPGVGEWHPSGFRCDLQPKGGEALAHWNEGGAALVRHRYGKGEVFSLGFNLSSSHDRGQSEMALTFFRRMAAMLPLCPLLPESFAGKVSLQRRGNEKEMLYFLFNLTDEDQIMPFQAQETLWGPEQPSAPLTLPGGKTWIGRLTPSSGVPSNGPEC